MSHFPEKALRMCNVQCYYRYEGVGGVNVQKNSVT